MRVYKRYTKQRYKYSCVFRKEAQALVTSLPLGSRTGVRTEREPAPSLYTPLYW